MRYKFVIEEPKPERRYFFSLLTKRDVLNLTVFLPFWMLFGGVFLVFALYGYNVGFLPLPRR